MSTITFYRQARADGGVRTGVDVDGRQLFSHLEKGATDTDPALLWYVDVRCSGPNLPQTPARVRRWLTDASDLIVGVLEEAAASVPLGIDPSDWPLQRARIDKVRGVKVAVVCSAVRRADAKDIARHLLDIAREWPSLISALGDKALSHA